MIPETQPWPANEPPSTETATPTPPSNQPSAKVDLQALAQRLYALLREELRITRERAG